MSLVLSLASPEDAARIAQIHMAAFGQNGMPRAQFPTPEVREKLRHAIEAKALADIMDPNITVLVVQATVGAQQTTNGHCLKPTCPIIRFAKWIHPVFSGDYTEPPWVRPEGTVLEVLDAWTRKVEEAE